MIQANTLRIGNKIIANGLHGGKIMTVEEIGGKGTLAEENRVITFKEHHVGEFVRDCKGVELSPAILEACGFDKDYDGNYRFQIEKWVFHWFPEYETIEIGKGANLSEYTRIKTLHQLQNAVHALTGFELTINLEKVKV